MARLIDRIPTGRTYQQYINPERAVPNGARRVHRLSNEFLEPYPVFSEIARTFVEFVSGATLVIHNARFDMGFINGELELVGRRTIPNAQVLDTLSPAKKRHPGRGNGLDALCLRYGVAETGREKHGALLDAELLAAVYLNMTVG